MTFTENESNSRIPLRDALTTLAEARQADDLVITNQGSSRVWPLIAEHPLDFHLNPSTMGGAIPLGLGIALAQPDRHVITLTGDGSLLMSMGSLVTVMATGCENLTTVLLDNKVYDVTGQQKTAASELNIDYLALARSIGFPTVVGFSDSTSWNKAVRDFLQSTGPRFAWVRVDPALPEDMKTKQEPMKDQLARLHREMAR